MQSILDAITEWIKEILIGAINGNLSTMFGDVNEKVGTIAAEVGQTPQGWNAGIFNMIRAPTFRRSTQRQEPHPLPLNTAAPQNLRSAGTAAFTRGRFFYAAAYADRLLSACRTAADAAERIYLWHFSIAQ